MTGSQATRITSNPVSHGMDLRRHIGRVMSTLSLGLLLAAFAAWSVSSIPAIYAILFGTSLRFAIILAPLAMILAIPLINVNVSHKRIISYFLALSALCGLAIAYLFNIILETSIAAGFLAAATASMALSFQARFTRITPGSISGFLIAACIGVSHGALLCLFLRSGPMTSLATMVTLLVFLLPMIYDRREVESEFRIMCRSSEADCDPRFRALGALRLYLGFGKVISKLRTNMRGIIHARASSQKRTEERPASD